MKIVAVNGSPKNKGNTAQVLLYLANYWNIIYGTAPGDISQDEEGKQILRVLAKNMSWALRLVEAGEIK